ncbi:uncharacterized protein LOC108239321 [Kryptolebias marmoratus]|uniref:Uncharacterized LOC108239321 n=1 Tax=Kryptolebias marmoratus TaxID=37003 RepID=A0A3Q3BF56_KRYMA|nr:uncharacterized protein LOC108239321 [Kryptolebias marmoratus]
MMKQSGAIVSCVALLLFFTSASAIEKLDKIDDLRRLKFGQTIPSHSLLLLYWFADTIDINNNNVMRLTFDPNSGDYGSHHYGNYERLLDPLPQGNIRYRYYTVGNLNQEMSSELPSYVVHPRHGYEGRNRDRIIFRVREQNVGGQGGQIDRVYITQHFETSDNQGTRYDPAHTYQVSTNLLRQIREFSEEENDNLMDLRNRFGSNTNNAQLRYITSSWGQLACLGLFLYMVIQEKQSSNQPNRRQSSTRKSKQPDFVVNIPERRPYDYSRIYGTILQNQRDEMKLQVMTGSNGKARILWSKVPVHLINEGVMVVLYKNDAEEKALTYKSIGNNKSGSYDTSVSLNEGLQVRLHKVKKICCFWSRVGEEIERGAEFKNPPAVSIEGFNASLQLFVKDGKACARIYVKNSFGDWRTKFKDSWIGFYSSANKATNKYEWWQWQWATKFQLNTESRFQNFSNDIVYEYHSGMTIAPGIQARFILRDEVEKACTPSWRE